jgi:hypothetical protein
MLRGLATASLPGGFEMKSLGPLRQLLGQHYPARLYRSPEKYRNLGSHLGVRKWMPATRYHFADTCGVVINRKSMKPRIIPATHSQSWPREVGQAHPPRPANALGTPVMES